VADDYGTSGRAFRVVYNGGVITDRMDGCEEGAELCDLDRLVAHLNTFAATDRDCKKKGDGPTGAPTPAPPADEGEGAAVQVADGGGAALTTGGWLLVTLVVAIASAVATGFVMEVKFNRSQERFHEIHENGSL
jgi:hypothetical protein